MILSVVVVLTLKDDGEGDWYRPNIPWTNIERARYRREQEGELERERLTDRERVKTRQNAEKGRERKRIREKEMKRG